MIRLFKFLGFLFSWVMLFVIVYVNHVVISESNYDVDLFGLLIVVAVLVGLIRYIDKRCELWEIHKEHRLFILNWRNGKKVILLCILTWLAYTIDMEKIQTTMLMMMLSSALGWFFTLLGNIKQNKKATSMG